MERSRLQALSVACGRVRVPKAYSNITLSVTSSLQGVTSEENSTECQMAAQVASDSGEQWCPAWHCFSWAIRIVYLLRLQYCTFSQVQLLPLWRNLLYVSCRHKLHAERGGHANQAGASA